VCAPGLRSSRDVSPRDASEADEKIRAAAGRILARNHGHRYYDWTYQDGVFRFFEPPVHFGSLLSKDALTPHPSKKSRRQGFAAAPSHNRMGTLEPGLVSNSEYGICLHEAYGEFPAGHLLIVGVCLRSGRTSKPSQKPGSSSNRWQSATSQLIMSDAVS